MMLVAGLVLDLQSLNKKSLQLALVSYCKLSLEAVLQDQH